MTGAGLVFSKTKVTLLYVPGATVLKPRSVRSPISRAKSTDCGVDSAETVAELLFRVMLSMVTLKPTTDDEGASSPVTKTLPDYELTV
jgi:hypothetical protein